MPSKFLSRQAWLSALVIVAGLSFPTAVKSGAISPDRQKSLIHLLRQDCGSCHGMTMKGGLGPGLLPVNLAEKPDETLTGIILDGVPGTPMPPWRPLLAPEEVAWMVKQLKEGLGR